MQAVLIMGILPMMYVSLLVLGLPGKLTAVASGDVTSNNHEGNWAHPSLATLDVCPKSCGNLSFDYPFGIGSSCSRGPDFDLTCNHIADSPRLFLHDGITEVIDNIDVLTDRNYYYYPQALIPSSFWRTITMKSGVSVYNMSYKLPGSSFAIGSSTVLNITGCNLDVYLVNNDKNITMRACRTVCPDQGITEMVAMRNCNGFGCCRVLVVTPAADGFHFKFVQGRNKSNTEAHSNQTSQLWDRISIMTDGDFLLSWSIRDQPTCVSAMRNRTTYACMSKHTECVDSSCSKDVKCVDGGMPSRDGYQCTCISGYAGNPYIPDGCSSDKGYNPIPSRTNCPSRCGDITVQFPFGLEDGCFARKEFHLNCTNITSSAVLQMDYSQVIDMNVPEGTIKLAQPAAVYAIFGGGRNLFVGFEQSVKWAAANLSCLVARQNRSGYACVSMNSKCVAVNTADNYIGYRCKCSEGFQGNPYTQNGCQDVDECHESNICQGICHNTEGSFYCTNCPRKTEYDPAKMRCTATKQQTLILGTIIGLSCGFSILLLSLTTLFLVRRQKRNAKKQLWKKYFRKNQGLLLEMLISSDGTTENEKSKIFSLEELEKATNNFDPTRVIGCGGHGMVYKGILSDQRVVAIKKSMVIEQREINQFINEVAILTQINHRNIVKLFGCCLESEVPLLVYDYVSSGSLSQVLHTASNDFSLSWSDYLRIALEAAGALSYLHSSASISIFHRDVKSSNILLDENYTAKVSDFGTSRLVPIDQTHIVTNVQGTLGYLDPEYFHTRQLNGKSDVYSFGVVLVELLLRMKPIFTSESGITQNLSNYFLQELKEGRITCIVNSQVLKEATEEEIRSVASLAEVCLRLHGEERPTMKQVEMELQNLRTKRDSSCQAGPRNEGWTRPGSGSSRAARQLSPMILGERVNLRSGDSQQCYSLEQEFISSASIPRVLFFRWFQLADFAAAETVKDDPHP